MSEATCPGCLKVFKRSAVRPFCNAACKAKDEKHAAWKVTQFRRSEAHRLGNARDLGHKRSQDLYDFVEVMIVPNSGLPTKEEIDAELNLVFDGLQAHAKCRSWFLDYGRKGYSKSHGLCEVCGDQLLCAGKVRDHVLRSLSQKECRDNNIYHAGNCYHVSKCTNEGCDFIRAVDSSD